MTGKRELDSKPVAPEALFNDINETAPLNTIYSIDVGTATSWSARFLNVSPTQKFILSSYLGTMGCALPGAIAAKIIIPIDRLSRLMVMVRLQWSCRISLRRLNTSYH